MRAKAVRNTFEGYPPAAAWGANAESNISIGKEYEVYAVAVFQCRVSFQIINDIDHVDWLPAWFFTLIDQTVPSDWVCFSQEDELSLVLGPDFVAATEASYNSMVELELEPVAQFWRRVKALEESQSE